MAGILATSYGLNHQKAYAGMIADGELANIISKLNSTDDTIPYGKAVFRIGEDEAGLPTDASTADQFVGVAVRELNRAYMDGQAFGAVPNKDFSVLTAGVIWVTTGAAVTVGQPVYARVGTSETGDFAPTVGAGATLAVLVPNAKFVTSAEIGELAKISFVVGG